jgi:hypothetical protein
LDDGRRDLPQHHRNKVLSLVDRATGRAKSFVVKDFKICPGGAG